MSEPREAVDGEMPYYVPFIPNPIIKRCRMAKPNYAFAKRQRDLAKKQKKEEKRLRKAEASSDEPQEVQETQETQPPTPHDDKKKN